MAGDLRVTGGRLVRRRFKVPAAADRGLVRPTSDRVREALFSSLGDLVCGARALDAFAGSGALGIEALSRGAARATFLERDPRVVRALRQNVAELDLGAQAELRVGDARRLLSGLPAGAFELVLVDPPYQELLDEALLLELTRVLAPGGVLVLERDARTEDLPPPGLSLCRDRVYGSTRLVTWEKPAAL